MTVFENVAFLLREKTEMKEAEIRERVLLGLEQVGMSGAEGKYPAELSGGMKKRASSGQGHDYGAGDHALR